MRLDKFLAQMGAGTRKEVKKMIRDGLVTVGGERVSDPGMKINESDEVCLSGRPLHYEQYVYYMLNKPAGVVSATEDPRERTVIDLLMEKQPQGLLRTDLFPVGRLDKDTEGLLIITNDGALAHRLLSPKKHVDKVYFAILDGPVGAREQEMFAAGLSVDETLTAQPARLEIAGEEDAGMPLAGLKASGEEDAGTPPANTETSHEKRPLKGSGRSGTHVYVTIHEGKFHQVKRMFAAVGREVLYLKRLSMGPLALDEKLTPGQWRRLTEQVVTDLLGH